MNEISNALEPDIKKLKTEPTQTMSSLPVLPVNDAYVLSLPVLSVNDASVPSLPVLPVNDASVRVDVKEKSSTCDELVLHVPECVKKIVIFKSDGKSVMMDL